MKAEEEAKAAEAAKATAAAAPPPPPFSPATDSSEPLSASSSKAPSLPSRRQSTVSLSSLQRPAFPHKLDLSATALRLNPDDLSMPSGLASPVMLAPKTSIPQIAPDFPFGPPGEVTIDLTLDDDVNVGMPPPPVPPGIDPSVGNSADKPIELLDIDMDLFGDVGGSQSAPTMGNASASAATGPSGPAAVKEEEMDFGMFAEISAVPGTSEEDAKARDELLASFGASEPPTSTASGGVSQQPGNPLDSGTSPGSFLADIEAAVGGTNTQASGNASSDDTANFNLDFLKDDSMDMQALFDLNTTKLGAQSSNNAAGSNPPRP